MALTNDEQKIHAEFTREMTAREYLERQRASQMNGLANVYASGGMPNTTIVDTDGMVREIARLRKLVDPEEVKAKIQALRKFMFVGNGCATVLLKDVLEILG